MVLYEGKTVNVNIGSIKTVQILDVLGTGGFANVYKVKEVTTSKLFVLKHIQIKPTLKGREKDVLIQRVKNEGSIKIPSKYIVPLIGMSEIDINNYAILFKYINNTKEFADWILDNKETAWKIKKTLFVKILKGLNDAHSLNVIHRDLDPRNILITKSNEPAIIDFGCAKFKDKAVTITGEIFGKLPFMDPYSLLYGSKYVDAKADIYAMGIMLYQIISGGHYWAVADIDFMQLVGIIEGGKVKNIIEIEKVNTSFLGDDKLKMIIAKTTMFDPKNRIDSANEFIKLLGEKPDERIYPMVDFSITSPVLIIEDGSAKSSMNLIAVKEGEMRELNRTNLDITNKSISRRNHAFIERHGNKYFIFEGEGTEGKGTNGTFLNGTRLKQGVKNKVEIRHTDRVRFADLWTRFVFLKKD